MFDDCSARVSLIFRTASYSILFIFLNMDSEDSFNDFLGEAISDVENLRHMQFRRKQNEKRKKGPRDPRPKVLAMKLYHLPKKIVKAIFTVHIQKNKQNRIASCSENQGNTCRTVIERPL